VLVAGSWARDLPGEGAVIAVEDPVAGLGALARAWRRELGADVIAVTGSVGKTSTKDLIAALIAPQRTVVANPANYNTEIGLPLAVLGAPAGTEVLVLEMGMRGFGQIAELTAVAEPDVGVVTAIGPVHVEQVGSIEGVAQAKGELLVGLRDGATAVVPAGEQLLGPWLRPELSVVTFGPGGDVELEPRAPHAVSTDASTRGRAHTSASYTVRAGDQYLELELPFSAAHNLRNTLAAVGAARAVGVRPEGRVDVRFSALRGEHVQLPGGAVVINDCYNANPLSMRAALDDLSLQEPARRRVAVLGDMLELGADEREHHRQIGAYAASSRVDVLVTVGPLAAEMGARFEGEVHAVADARAAARLARDVVHPCDLVLVRGSRGVGLEVVAEALASGSAPHG
jgi:UDP-N-acetylmuramoyl-tripeptide--D-alanyl-D-alanine ligase